MTYSSFVVRRDDEHDHGNRPIQVRRIHDTLLVGSNPPVPRSPTRHEAGHALIEQRIQGTPTTVARPAHEE